MSTKYPRTPHLPFSEGMTNDDRMIESLEGLLGAKEVVITEKMDGSNTCLNQENVFARSHNQKAHHESFNWIKSYWAQIKFQIPTSYDLFGENCYAIHSIEYKALSSYFYLFGIRSGKKWSSWAEVEEMGKSLGLETSPVLFKGQIKTEAELRKIAKEIMSQESVFGGDREGFVIRSTDSFSDDDFDRMIGKCVRKNHVQTDEHWMHQKVRPQKLKR